VRPAIVVEELGKQFERYHPERPKRLKDLFGHRGLFYLKPVERFWALRHINFTLEPGRSLGVLGRNGSGKSTLLRLIGGVGRPDEGRVKARGRISALLDLGANFHPELTGRENINIGGVISGLTRREVAQRFDSIVAFAELEDFIDSPMRTYSSGMKMRLGFAVASHTDPEILLIDEVLAVGDVSFRRKCYERINQFKSEGCTILYVSHDSGQIQRLCDEALWLRDGQLVTHGDPEVVIGEYTAEMMAETRRRTVAEPPRTPTNSALSINKNRFGSLEIEIVSVRLLNQAGLPVTELNSGEPLQVEIEYSAPEPVENPIFGVAVSKESRQVCCFLNSAAAGMSLPVLQGSGRITLNIDRLDLAGDQYYVNVGIYESSWTYAYDYHWQVYSLTIRPTGGTQSILWPPHRWEVSDVPTSEQYQPALETS
jgi:lipopolysaccharide transport system ATP-binding protein